MNGKHEWDGLNTDALLDECLKQSFDHGREWGHIEGKDEPRFPFSQDYQERIAGMLSLSLRDVQRLQAAGLTGASAQVGTASRWMKVLSLLAAFLLGGVTFSVLNPDVRASFGQAVIRIFGVSNDLEFPGFDPIDIVNGEYQIKFLPDGYELTEANESKFHCTYVFECPSESKDVTLIVQDNMDGSCLNYDGEHTTTKRYDINGHEGYLIESQERNLYALIWQTNGYSFLMMGNTEPVKLTRIAEHIVEKSDYDYMESDAS